MMAPVQPPLRRQRSKLFVSCAFIALATASALPQSAHAQVAPTGAFQGNPVTALGSVTYDRATLGSETITVNSSTATINWSPYDTTGTGPIDFLPSGYVATFVNNPSLTSDYTVLNRIVPTDPSRSIMLNGQVIGQITDGINSSTGGHVWFYSPGGILIGSSAIIDVGGLLLSTADLPNGFTANATGFSAYFAAPGGSASAIQILNGAQINAPNVGSYVALVAPRIEQGGNVQVNGAAAYAAGEQLSMTMNQGLFDIQVDVGTDDGNGIVHTGTTGGPASTNASTDPHRIYMVAVPKNQALTMLLGGSVGFDSATVAGVENGEILLGSGWHLADGPGGVFGNASFGLNAGISFGPGSYTSTVFGWAVGDIFASAASASVNFAGDLHLVTSGSGSTGNIVLAATGGNTLSVGGNIDLSSLWPTSDSQLLLQADSGSAITVGGSADLSAVKADGNGGRVSIVANGGSIDIGGIATIDVDAVQNSAPATTISAAANGQGGHIDIEAWNSGTVATGGLQLSANGVGQDGTGGLSSTAGAGHGGNIYVNADSSGEISINGNVNAIANGTGGNMLGTASFGGAGTGGWAGLTAGDGTINVTGAVTINAEGFGGTVGAGGPAGTGGNATGGFSILNTYGPGSITVGGATSLVSNATGGDGQTGGNARGGNAGAYGTDGTITLANIYAAARAAGGSATFGFGGNGGDAQGGAAYVEADADVGNIEVPPTANGISGLDAIIDVTGVGGSGGAGDGASIAAGSGGDGIGGFFDGNVGSGGAFALADADGASLTLRNVTLISDGIGGTGGVGGSGQVGGMGGAGEGGLSQAGLYSQNGLTPSGTAAFADVAAYSSGEGGDGGAGGAGQGDGGDAWGGGSFLNARGTVTAADVTLFSGALGGAGTNGGDAIAGNAQLESFANSTMTISGDVIADSSGTGGAGSNSGGDGSGYDAEAAATDANSHLTISGMTTVVANGLGGAATASGGFGGNGYGGIAGIHGGVDSGNSGGSATFHSAVVKADGVGGSGDAGGQGFGGDAHAGSREGTFSLLGSLTGEANGYGGSGTTSGGVGWGGTFLIAANFDGDVNPASTSLVSADIQTIGFGGNGVGSGATGGDGYGGEITIDAPTANSTLHVGTLTANAKGQGGDGGDGASGGDGGSGYGGYVSTNILGTMTGGEWTALVRGVGGDGGTGSSGVGGDGGYGEGGATSFYSGQSSIIDAASYSTSVNGIGGAGGAGVTGAGNGGEAQGGYNEATFDGSHADFTGQFLVTAFAMGGDGANGGDAFGGTSLITVNGALSADFVQSTGQAQAGAGLAGAGGNAGGGSGEIDIFGNLAANGMFIGATALGGNGATGGEAVGGFAYLYSTGSLSATDINVAANAIGGSSSNDIGGNALAGEAILESHGSFVSTGNISITSDGEGGDGSIFGGTGAGYSAALRIGGGTAQLTGTTTVRSAGTGGDSTGGTGGYGFGGYARTSTYGGAVSTLNALTVDSSGIGGDGLNGGAGYGSVNDGGWGGSGAQVLDAGSQLNLTGQTALISNGTGGSGTSGTGGNAGAGTTHLTAASQPISAQNIFMAANGTGGAGASGGGSAAGGQSVVVAAGAPLTISGTAVVQANATAPGGGGAVGGSVFVSVDSGSFADAAFTALGNGGTVDLGVIQASGHVEARSGGDMSFGNISAGHFQFESGGSVTGGNITASGRVDGEADGAISLGNITVGPNLPSAHDFSVGIESATSISVGNVSAPGNVGFATLGDLDAGNLRAGSLILALVGDGISVGSLTTAATGQTYMGNASMFLAAGGPDDFDPSLVLGSNPVPTGGSISIGGPVATGSFKAAASGDLTAGSISAAGTIFAGAGGDLTVGNVAAGDTANFISEGLATFLGTVNAPAIVVTSGDIDIAGGASLGVRGTTNLVVLNAINDSIEIGGTAVNPDSYHLAEEGDISGGALILNAIGSGEGLPSVTVHDVQIEGSQTAGRGVGSVSLNTLGSVVIDGDVNFINAGPADLLAINAGNGIAVDTDTGSITMTGAGGALAGTLALTAHNVWVADGALLAQLQADPNFPGRDAALATNNGATNPGGYLQAGGVVVTMTGSSFMVQNSGTSTQPAGLTVGEGGLSIFNTGPDAATVIVSGRQMKSGGAVVDGNAFAQGVQVNSPGGLTTDSSVNGCAIGGCAAPQPQPEPQPTPPPQVLGAESILGPVGLLSSPDTAGGDDSKDKEDKTADSDGNEVDPAVYLINAGPMHVDQVIDTPVTSGNDSPGGLN